MDIAKYLTEYWNRDYVLYEVERRAYKNQVTFLSTKNFGEACALYKKWRKKYKTAKMSVNPPLMGSLVNNITAENAILEGFHILDGFHFDWKQKAVKVKL